MLHEFIAHAHTVVLNGKLILCKSIRRAGLLRDPHVDRTARTGILDRIAEQIEQHLVQTQLITVNILVAYIQCINM